MYIQHEQSLDSDSHRPNHIGPHAISTIALLYTGLLAVELSNGQQSVGSFPFHLIGPLLLDKLTLPKLGPGLHAKMHLCDSLKRAEDEWFD